MKTLLSILLFAAANTAFAAPPVAIDFSNGQPADYFTNETADNVRLTETATGRGMQLSGKAAWLLDIEVKPSTRYALRLTAAFDGDAESMEENPRFEVFCRLGQTSPRLPSREIQFLDAAGKPTGRTLKYAMPFKKQRTYHDEFYTPSTAETVRIRLIPGKDARLLLSQAHFAETAGTDLLNINPSFELGPNNYSGWRNISQGGQLIRRNGKTVLDTKYGSTGQRIPLSQPGTYALSAKATANGYNSIVIVRVYNQQGQELMRSSTRKYGPRTYFVPPADAAYISLLVYSCLLEEVKIQRVGDENTIRSLQAK